MALNVLLLEHAETLADLDRAQTYVVVFVQSEGTFYYWDGNSWEPTAGGGGGGSLAIGEEVTGGLAGSVLYIDAAGDLGNDADFTFDPATGELGLTGSIDLAGDLGMVGDLDVTGAVGITGNLVVTGLFETSDDVEINGDLSLPTAASSISVNGTLTLSGSSTTSFTTPTSATVPTKINIPLFDPGAFGQIVAMGLGNIANANRRVLSIFDGRAAAHNPSISVISPDDNNLCGVHWNGSNSIAVCDSTTGFIGIRTGSTAPDDSQIANGYSVFYEDATNLYIRVRRNNGTLELITLPF